LVWHCSENRPPPCQTCRLEKEEKDRKVRRDKDLELERQAKQRAYAKELAAIRDAIAEQQIMKDRREEQAREQTLRQHQAQLASVTKEAKKLTESSSLLSHHVVESGSSPSTGVSTDTQEPSQGQEDKFHDVPGQRPTEQLEASNHETSGEAPPDVSLTHDEGPAPARLPSSSERDWQNQKALEFASNEALDSLMQMIGLESVKKEFLNIKARVDTAIRQCVDLNGDRFGAALLGNPGTGEFTC
jgi:hypothetical protein